MRKRARVQSMIQVREGERISGPGKLYMCYMIFFYNYATSSILLIYQYLHF